jgi:hypothetical protein
LRDKNTIDLNYHKYNQFSFDEQQPYALWKRSELNGIGFDHIFEGV